jgi:ribosomal protein S17E
MYSDYDNCQDQTEAVSTEQSKLLRNLIFINHCVAKSKKQELH